MGRLLVIAVLLALVAAACATPEPGAVPGTTYDPVEAGEELPDGFRQLLARDHIRPIYDPTFASVDEVDWPLDSLVLGVEIDGSAKAYPIPPLNSREMVIDRLAGIPILVTW